MPQSRSPQSRSAVRPAVEDDDYRIALSTLRLTAPHMTDEQLSGLLDIIETVLDQRSARRPEEMRSFDPGP